MQFRWDEIKNKKLIRERGVSFEMCIAAIQSGGLLSVEENTRKYSHQKIFVLEMGEYVYLVPFVEERGGSVFLKTIIPSRKAKKKFFGKISKQGV